MDPDSGAVLIDGQDIRNFTLSGLRRQVSVAPQDAPLFAGTVAENVAMGLAAMPSVAQCDAAALAIGVTDIVAALPEGWLTAAGERGARLSGGQRRAISLVRAMLRDAPILVLDEPTAGLYPETAESVRRAIRAMEGQRTVIVITHDVAGLTLYDHVLRLEAGRLIGAGAEPVREMEYQ